MKPLGSCIGTHVSSRDDRAALGLAEEAGWREGSDRGRGGGAGGGDEAGDAIEVFASWGGLDAAGGVDHRDGQGAAGESVGEVFGGQSAGEDPVESAPGGKDGVPAGKSGGEQIHHIVGEGLAGAAEASGDGGIEEDGLGQGVELRGQLEPVFQGRQVFGGAEPEGLEDAEAGGVEPADVFGRLVAVELNGVEAEPIGQLGDVSGGLVGEDTDGQQAPRAASEELLGAIGGKAARRAVAEVEADGIDAERAESGQLVRLGQATDFDTQGRPRGVSLKRQADRGHRDTWLRG